MTLMMRSATQQTFGTARPTGGCRRAARLVVKGATGLREQKPAHPQRSTSCVAKRSCSMICDRHLNRNAGCRQLQVPVVLRSAGLAAVANVLAVLPAHAEAGKIFDFNLTLPVMATQFLLLMVFLEKTWFTPVGKALDERDANLRAKLGSVKDNSGDLKKLQEEAESVLREARQAAQAMIKEAKSKTQEEQGKKLAATKEVCSMSFEAHCTPAMMQISNDACRMSQACAQ